MSESLIILLWIVGIAIAAPTIIGLAVFLIVIIVAGIAGLTRLIRG